MDIASMLEVQVKEVKEVDSKENVTPKSLPPSTANGPPPISQDETNFYKLTFGNDISQVRFYRLHCTACDAHIGSAPSQSENMFQHPVIRTLLCAKCRDFYGDGTFEQGDDATDMFCRWCANGGNLYCCSYCNNTFCSKCIRRNFDPRVRKRIEADEKWKCFVCDPADLYAARAICWALLQHIQTITRIIHNDRTMTADEKEEKMNLDDTTCCPRRKKRKRRKTGSDSEEEDLTYTPPLPTMLVKRRKKASLSGGRTRLSNGVTNTPIAIKPHIVEHRSDGNEIPPSLLSCEQSMIECENATVNADGTVVSPATTSSVVSRLNPTIVQQPLYNTTIMNVVAAPNYVQPSSSVVPLRHIAGTLNRVNLFHAVPCSQPMVTIPNQNTGVIPRRILLPDTRTSTATVATNVIEIESDSDETTVVGSSRSTINLRKRVNRVTATGSVVPVALVSSKSKYTVVKKPTVPKKKPHRTLNQRLVPHCDEVELVLATLKCKLHNLFDASKRQERKRYDLTEGRRVIKRFHHEIRNAVTQVAFINDRIVREYNRWKRTQIRPANDTDSQSSRDSNHVIERVKSSSVKVPLDMTCVNESDTETEAAESEVTVIPPSDLVGSTNVVEGIKFFRKKNSVDRATGDGSLQYADKGVQKNDEVAKDFEKLITQSVVTKCARGHEDSTNFSRRQQFDKYEEQYIFYLQSIEDRRMEMDDCKELPDPNETSLKDLIEANSPFISEMLENIDKSIISDDSSKTSKCEEEGSNATIFTSEATVTKTSPETAPETASGSNSKTCEVVEKPVKIVNKNADDLDTSKTKRMNASIRVLNESLKEHRKERLCVNEKTSETANALTNNTDGKRKRNFSVTNIRVCTANEDDCTIIDE